MMIASNILPQSEERIRQLTFLDFTEFILRSIKFLMQ